MVSRRLLSLLVSALLLAAWAVASDNKSSQSDQYSNLHVTVVKDDNNKPVRNASVILHPVNKDGKQGKGGFQLKTDNEGNTETEGIPYGPLRIQVLAPGFQTFGDDYQVNQPNMDIQIRLKRPGEQFSTYDKPKTTPPPATENKPR
jgi:hypothetical protein